MTPNQIVNAYKAIRCLSDVVLPYKKARELSRLKKRIADEFGVVVEMESALVDKYRGKRDGGKYTFDSPETTNAFLTEYEKAMEQDAVFALRPVDLSDHIGQLKISVEAIEALDGIIIFEKDESDG